MASARVLSRLLLAVGIVAVTLTMPALPTASAAPPASVVAVRNAAGRVRADVAPPLPECGQAAAELVAAHPQRALTRLEAAPSGSCPEVRAAAEAARDDAAAKARDAAASVGTDPAKAWRLAREAGARDADNALAAAVAARAPRWDVTRWQASWDWFAQTWLAAAETFAEALLGVVTVVLLLARVLVLLRPLPGPRGPLARSQDPVLRAVERTQAPRWRRYRLWDWRAGLMNPDAHGGLVGSGLTLAAGSGVLVGLAPGGPGERDAGWPWWAGAGACAVGAVLVLWFAMSTHLRIAVEVRDREGRLDQAATGEVVGLLGRLGADRPRGLEIPRGSDVSALDGAVISGVPGVGLAARVTNVLTMALGITPWRLGVDVPGEDRICITVTRHGETLASGVVDRYALELTTPRARTGADADSSAQSRLPSLYRFASAMLLVELSKEYLGFEGLFGVRDWRSLGLTDIGTSHYTGHDDQDAAVAVLTAAVRADRRNRPALVALRNRQDRLCVDRDQLESYRRFLVDLDGELAGLAPTGRLGEPALGTRAYPAEPLRARVLFSLLVATINLVALGVRPDGTRGAPKTGADAAAQERARTMLGEAARTLIRLIDHLAGVPDHGCFAEEMKPSAAYTYLQLDGRAESFLTEPDDEIAATAWTWARKLRPDDARSHYNYACSLLDKESRRQEDGTVGVGVPLQQRVPEAIDHLRLALADPHLRAWMPEDPWLTPWWTDPSYGEQLRRALRSGPVTDLLAVAPFATHAEALRAAGLDTVEAIAGLPGGELASLLDLRHAVADRLVRLARLIDALGREFGTLALTVAGVLGKHGIGSRGELATTLRTAADRAVAGDVQKALLATNACPRGMVSMPDVDGVHKLLVQSVATTS